MNAKIIDNNLQVVLGQMITVLNQNKKLHENNNYIAIQIEDYDGSNERCVLFTEIELSDVKKVKCDLINDNLKLGRLCLFKINNKEQYLLKIRNRNLETIIVRLSKTLLNRIEKRAKSNNEDLTKKGFIVDLFD